MSKDKQEKSALEKEIDGYLMNEIERLTAERDELVAEIERKMSAAEFIIRQNHELSAHVARLRSYLVHILEYCTQDGNNQELFDMLCHIEETVKAELAATPEQSLARLKNQVREECAIEADRQFEDEPYGHAKFRCANIALEIRAMKEAE